MKSNCNLPQLPRKHIHRDQLQKLRLDMKYSYEAARLLIYEPDRCPDRDSREALILFHLFQVHYVRQQFFELKETGTFY